MNFTTLGQALYIQCTRILNKLPQTAASAGQKINKIKKYIP